MGFFDKIRTIFKPAPVTSQKVPLGAISTKRAYMYNSISETLPNPDVILQKNNETLEAYRNFLYDAHVASCIQSRKAGVLSLEWDINRGGAKTPEADFIYQVFKKLPLRQIISEILDTPYYGYKPLEIFWTFENGRVTPTDVIGKPPWWFDFDANNMPRFKNRNAAEGEFLPPRKILIMQHNATYDNPYGEAVLSRCYYPVIFKKGGMKLWSIYAQKYGMPFLHGKVGVGKNSEDMLEFYAVLEKLQQDGIAITGEDASIEILTDATNSNSSQVYRDLCHFCNAEISKAILSQTLTTEQGDTGSYAMSQTHLQVRKDVVDSDKQLVESALNKLIEWIVIYNFGNLLEMPRFELYQEEDVDMTLAQRDQTLASTQNMRFTKPYFMRAYGFKDDEIEIITPPAPGAGAPAFAETTTGEAEQGSPIDLAQFDELTQMVLEPILDRVNRGVAYNEIQDDIIEMFPTLDTTAIEDFLAKGILLSSAAGVIAGAKV